MDYESFLTIVVQHGVDGRERAARASRATLRTLGERIDREEARMATVTRDCVRLAIRCRPWGVAIARRGRRCELRTRGRRVNSAAADVVEERLEPASRCNERAREGSDVAPGIPVLLEAARDRAQGPCIRPGAWV